METLELHGTQELHISHLGRMSTVRESSLMALVPTGMRRATRSRDRDIFMTSVVMVSKFYFFSDFDRYWAGRPLTGILLETRFICRKRSLKLHVKYGLSQKPLIPTGQTIFDTELPQYVIWEHFCQKLYPNIIINQWSFKVKFVSLLLVMSI